ncbi:serine/threonine-protein kinase [Actinoplanes sp. NEAU-A12]|uniref:Serine/threonine-protein kinase n=1 Tax=Actinoplanes sandaracinus TaxID=3045177 RepID=A0ABT6WRY6_9ACTN|nr:serine/threonine-protein kinase [Actinoplanes sandaracinus]MDI6102464.1 serine/threonine-protein kinase [Actinoplanes sandaracinus]
MAGHEPLGREYLLHEEIGRGAMAVVRRATSRHGGPPLAAKLLRPELAGDRRVRELFLREEAALRALDHPAIVGLRDLIVEGGTLALVMEFVDGPNLRRYLSFRGGRLTPPEVVAVAAQTATALAVAHERGVVHLDLKPENLLVRRGSTPPEIRITDFGVAVLLNDADHGAAGGTPGYTAPEIFQGGPPTPAADVWSLGVLLLELTTGRPTGDPSALPGPLGPVARDCLAADPRRRPPARRVASYLRQFAAGQVGGRPFSSPPVPPVSGPPTAGRTPSDEFEPTTLSLGFPPPRLPQPSFPPPAPPQPPRAAFVGPRDTIGQWAGRLPETGPYQPVVPAPPPPSRGPSRWRRGPLVTLGAAALVAAVMTGLNLSADAGARTSSLVTQVSVPPAVSPVEAGPSASSAASPGPAQTLPPTSEVAVPPLNTPDAERLRVTMAGKVDDDAGTLAISIRDGQAIAYICDGDRLEAWLKGTAQNGLLNLTGKKDSKITGLFDANRAAGEITVEGRAHRFEIGVVRKPSGLYRLAGQVGGAKVAGSWIVLPDGRQVGVLIRGEGEQVGPAPVLDVANRTTTVDGATVTGATTIDVDTGEGF